MFKSSRHPRTLLKIMQKYSPAWQTFLSFYNLWEMFRTSRHPRTLLKIMQKYLYAWQTFLTFYNFRKMFRTSRNILCVKKGIVLLKNGRFTWKNARFFKMTSAKDKKIPLQLQGSNHWISDPQTNAFPLSYCYNLLNDIQIEFINRV